MDRTIVYPGAIPQDTDILQPQRNIMEAIGFALQATLGVQTVVDGLTCTQAPSPNMTVVVGPGSIIQNSVVDQNAYGSLPADTTDALVKMGINITSTTLGPFTAPSTAGQSQNFLIQAALSETDTGAVVLPYYNASNPSAPYSGPNNNATAQNTARTATVNLQIVAGSPATTGSQNTPAPSTGYVGLWVITIANGQSSITNSSIALYAGAPFINGTGAAPSRGIQAGRLLKIRNFTASGTYTPTPGTNTIIVEVYGGGGAGGGAGNTSGANQFADGGGGASGSYARSLLSNAQTYRGTAITIGVGGVGSTFANGGAGGTSSFGAFLSAPGGGGGLVGSYAASGSIANGGQPGAAGSGGNIDNFSGAPGSVGIVVASSSTTSAFGVSGAGASSPVGSGGGVVVGTTAGNPAVGHAAGGGGASVNGSISTAVQAGGAGTGGLVRVWEYA
jgi:hypothetical protein